VWASARDQLPLTSKQCAKLRLATIAAGFTLCRLLAFGGHAGAGFGDLGVVLLGD
jgi:hypothetical protein